MARVLFVIFQLFLLSGCYDTAYQPHYIISHEDVEVEDVLVEPEKALL
ncbi:MAG: hypothetical protein V4494_00025 [Chlamydiota bacterium]